MRIIGSMSEAAGPFHELPSALESTPTHCKETGQSRLSEVSQAAIAIWTARACTTTTICASATDASYI